MKIKLAVYETDRDYLQKLNMSFANKYADQVEIYAFSNEAYALQALTDERIDVFLACEDFEMESGRIPDRCAFAYLTDGFGVGLKRVGEGIRSMEYRAIGKYQKTDLIYKEILGLYAEKGGISQSASGEGMVRTIMFTSPCGGCGVSTAAAAFAIHKANQGKRVLYLDMETLESTDCLFTADGAFSMTDIIYSLKKNQNLSLDLKLDSCLRKDGHGVNFLAATDVALRMMELTIEEKNDIVNAAVKLGSFDYIIVDIPFSFDEGTRKMLLIADTVIWLGDGTEISNEKILRAYRALQIMEEGQNVRTIDRTMLLYNRFGSRKTQVNLPELAVVDGSIPRLDKATSKETLMWMSEKDVFDKIG